MAKKKKNEMLVEENQYRAVITKTRSGWSASVQRRIGIDEWEKVRCGLKGVVFATREYAENVSRLRMKEQISLDKDTKDDVSYIIYPN